MANEKLIHPLTLAFGFYNHLFYCVLLVANCTHEQNCMRVANRLNARFYIFASL